VFVIISSKQSLLELREKLMKIYHPGGMAYTFQVILKGYSFAPQTLTVNNNLADLNFTAQP
jgi:hypothetical protein